MADDRLTYEVNLGYFKKGDDARRFRDNAADDAASFLAHAEALEEDANVLRRLAVLARGYRLSFSDADTHWIFVSCDKTLGDQLVQEHVLRRSDDATESEDDA